MNAVPFCFRAQRAALPLGLLFAVVPLSAAAHELPDSEPHREDADPEPERYQAPSREDEEYRSEQYAAFEFRVGPYRPDVDAEFGGNGGPFEESFGDGQSVMVGFEGDYQVLRIPYFGTVGPGLSWGIARYAGNAFFGNGEESNQPTSFWVMPFSALGVVRIDTLALDLGVPIVPYAKGGFLFGLWEAGDAGRVSTAGRGIAGQGSSYGYQVSLGAMLHLNFFAPQAAIDLDNSSGVNHSYLFLEWLKTDADSGGRGMQLGTSTWMTGIAIEY